MALRVFRWRAGALALAVALGGCEVAKKVDQNVDALGSELKQTASLPKAEYHGGLRISETPILGNRVRRPPRGIGLPNGAEGRSIGWQSDQPVTLQDVAARLTEMTGLRFRAHDRRSGMGGGISLPDMPVSSANAAAAFQTALAGGVGGGRAIMIPPFEGTLGEFLRILEARYDLTVSVKDGEVILDAYQNLTCHVPAPPTNSTISAEVSGATTGAASGPSGSTSAQSSQTKASLDTFGEIRAYLDKAVGGNGVYEVSPSLRRFSVTAPADVTRRVKDYCDELVDFLSTRIAVEATIIELTVNEGDDYGLNLEPMWKQAAGVNFGLQGVAPAIVGTAGSGSIRVLPVTEGGKSLHWAASQAVIKAASNDGRLANKRHAVATLQNGRAQTLNLTTRQDYIPETNNVIGTANTASSSGTKTSTINYGYSMQVTAHSVGADNIQVHGSLTVSDLAAQIDKSVGNGQVVQLLTVPQRAFDLDIPLANGETLVMSGNENVRARRDRSGLIDPSFFLLGGADKASYETTRVVLFLTAWRLTAPKPRTGELGGGERQ